MEGSVSKGIWIWINIQQPQWLAEPRQYKGLRHSLPLKELSVPKCHGNNRILGCFVLGHSQVVQAGDPKCGSLKSKPSLEASFRKLTVIITKFKPAVYVKVSERTAEVVWPRGACAAASHRTHLPKVTGGNPLSAQPASSEISIPSAPCLILRYPQVQQSPQHPAAIRIPAEKAPGLSQAGSMQCTGVRNSRKKLGFSNRSQGSLQREGGQ